MLKLGTNYEYGSRRFLDSRQGAAESKEDLKNWTIPVPVGFQVCLNDVWYYYDPLVNLPDTGHWVSCIESNASEMTSQDPINPDNRSMSLGLGRQLASDISKRGSELEELMKEVFPLTIEGIKINEQPSLILQPGQSTSIRLTWKNCRKGKPTSLIDWGEVISPIPGDTAKIGMTYDFYNSSTNLTPTEPGDFVWTISVKIGNSLSASKKVSVPCMIKTYYGTSDQIMEQGSRILEDNLGLGSSYYTRSGSFEQKNFDCSGGKFPYILVPEMYFNDNRNVIIGGLVNSDIVKTNINIVNKFNTTIPYVAYRTTGIQTGSAISIEVK